MECFEIGRNEEEKAAREIENNAPAEAGNVEVATVGYILPTIMLYGIRFLHEVEFMLLIGGLSSIKINSHHAHASTMLVRLPMLCLLSLNEGETGRLTSRLYNAILSRTATYSESA